MRRSVEELNRFYTTPEGQVVKAMVQSKLTEAWPDVRGLDVLGIGYGTPYLSSFNEARRILMAMPAGQGAEIWPEGMKVRSTLVDEAGLPFPTALFDRVLMMHALEESQDSQALLCEASRILSPNGRLIICVAARGGLWAHADKTPFGFGRPFSRSQLEDALREAELEPLAWSYALYVPPLRSMLRWAKVIEQILPKIWPLHGGLILMEAGRKPFVAAKREVDRSIMAEIREALSPKPVATSRDMEPQSRR